MYVINMAYANWGDSVYWKIYDTRIEPASSRIVNGIVIYLFY